MTKLLLTIPVVAFFVSCAATGMPVQSETDRLKDKSKILEAEVNRLKSENTDLRNANAVMKSSEMLYDDVSDELQKALADLKVDGVEKLPNGSYSFAVDLLFSPGSDKIHAEGERVLRKFLGMWKGREVKFKIVGHTDRDPIQKTAMKYTTKTNLELGMARSLRVMEFFMKNGMRESQMFIGSAGNNEPVAPNDEVAANKKKNRRVEVFVLKNNEASFK